MKLSRDGCLSSDEPESPSDRSGTKPVGSVRDGMNFSVPSRRGFPPLPAKGGFVENSLFARAPGRKAGGERGSRLGSSPFGVEARESGTGGAAIERLPRKFSCLLCSVRVRPGLGDWWRATCSAPNDAPSWVPHGRRVLHFGSLEVER